MNGDVMDVDVDVEAETDYGDDSVRFRSIGLIWIQWNLICDDFVIRSYKSVLIQLCNENENANKPR